jgi:hypothetical protein
MPLFQHTNSYIIRYRLYSKALDGTGFIVEVDIEHIISSRDEVHRISRCLIPATEVPIQNEISSARRRKTSSSLKQRTYK